MLFRMLAIGALLAAATRCCDAQSPEQVDIRLSPQRAVETAAPRLLPTDPELEEGNAAVVMLRMIWEQQPFMQKGLPQIRELFERPYDDPQIVNEFRFGRFQSQMRRAAYMRDAEWEYPLDEEPLVAILLPDVQGFRDFVGRGMSLWVGQQIAKGDLDAAREGILVQLACGRHIARTPLVINHMVATAIAEMALTKAELLVQQPGSPNLYWALATLPDHLGDTRAVVQWESQFIPGSLPSLSQGIPEEGDERWKQVAAEFWEMSSVETGKRLSASEATSLQTRLKEIAEQERDAYPRLAERNFDNMSDEEIAMRWVLAASDRLSRETEHAYTLPPALALAKLQKVETTIAENSKRTGMPPAVFVAQPVNVYLSLHRFDRRVKFLQTVEAIRDYAGHHDGQLPPALDDMELPAPDDPLTREPFEYSVDGSTATLRMAPLEGIDSAWQRQRVYQIRLAD